MLQSFRFGSALKPAKWQNCDDSQDFIKKKILSLQVLWHVVEMFRTKFDELQRKPTRQCWKACTQDCLSTRRAHTSGCFSDYSLKIALDGFLLSLPSLERVVSWWPMGCPAYTDQLPKLYPACNRTHEDLWLAGCHFHRQLKARFPKFFLRDSLAQTCWLERGVTA